LIGRFGGFLLLSKVSSKTTLFFAALMAIICIVTAIVGNGIVAVFALVLLGLCHSVMWPCIFPMSIKGLGVFTSLGSSILIMMVVGGAVVPVFQGFIIDKLGYTFSFVIEAVCYVYILYFAWSDKE
jgi:FHS family L-fucose permease-like MFS transporter